MTRHVNLLGILYIVSGCLNLLLGVSTLALALGAAAIVGSGSAAGGVTGPIIVVAFTVVAVMALLWGVANLWAGHALRRYRPSARLAGLVMAVLNLFVLPFGTALGIYALWVLLNDGARSLFEPGRA